MKALAKSIKVFSSAILLACAGTAQAGVVNLTTAGSSGVINGATYRQVDVQPAGSGVIDSFVEIQSNDPVEQAYNTTVNGVYDNGSSDTFNHEITVGSIGFIDLNGDVIGGEVMRFLLDINQSQSNPQGNNNSRLNLDEVQIFISGTPNQSIEPSLAQGEVLGLGTLVYQMDMGSDSWVILDSALNPGSGTADMYLDIPMSAFMTAFGLGGFNTVDAQNGAYVYLYSRFGSDPNENTSGFEEWAAIQGRAIGEPECPPGDPICDPTEIPEPGSLALLSLGLFGVAGLSRLRRRK